MKVYSVIVEDKVIACYPSMKRADNTRDRLAEKYPDKHIYVDCTTQLVTENTEDSELTFYSYTEDKQWAEVVLEFLAELSKVYGYTIDEFDMAGMVHNARMVRLGKIVDLDHKNDIATREFTQTIEHVMYWKDWAMRNRVDAHRVYEAMKPKGTLAQAIMNKHDLPKPDIKDKWEATCEIDGQEYKWSATILEDEKETDDNE